MARIRSIKPEFWTAEQVMELSRDARLLFVGLWNFCDDAGIHPAKVKTLKAEVFPSDDLTSGDVRRLIDECIAQDLVVEYEVDGEPYWQVTGWHHQKIDQPTFKHPTPEGVIPEGAAKRRSEKSKESRDAAKNPPNTSRTFAERSPNTSRTFAECSPPEGKGEEGKGVNRFSVASSSAPTTARAAADPPPPARALPDADRPIPDESPPPSAETSPTAAVCLGLKALGYGDTNPHDARLKALLQAGLTAEEIISVGEQAAGQGKGFRWVLATAEGRRRDAASIVPLPTPGTGPPRTDRAAKAALVANSIGLGRPHPPPETGLVIEWECRADASR